MATASDVREWARAGGQTVSDRGRIPEWLAQAWNDDHAADPFSYPDKPANGSAPDYPDGMTDDEFTAAAQPPEDTGESRPRTVRKRGNTTPAAGGIRARFGFGKAGSKKKAKKPRVGVEDLICSGWRLMARVARPMPPLQRVLRVQAPVAGALLEDAVKDTIVDTLLQPLARLQAGGKTVVALAGPPMIVTMVCLHVAQAQGQGRPPSRIFLETAREMLRESLLIWMDVAGPKFEAAMQREKDFEEKYGAKVDDFMDWLFSDPPSAEDEAAQAAEEQAVRRAQGILGDQA